METAVGTGPRQAAAATTAMMMHLRILKSPFCDCYLPVFSTSAMLSADDVRGRPPPSVEAGSLANIRVM
jgi:hypothetical protein